MSDTTTRGAAWASTLHLLEEKEVAKAFELRGTTCQTGQNYRLDSEGGGKIVLEFGEPDAEAWFQFRQAANGKALRILIEIE